MNDLDFKYKLSLMESGGNYRAVNNTTGALGKYQFLPSTLNALREKYNLPDWINRDNFLLNRIVQEYYMDKQLEDIRDYLNRNDLKKFIGETITGSKRFYGKTTRLTEYGLIAGAHLAGTGNLQSYFLSGYDPNDGQTSLSDYLYYFSDPVNYSNIDYAGGYLIPVLILAFMSLYLLYYD